MTYGEIRLWKFRLADDEALGAATSDSISVSLATDRRVINIEKSAWSNSIKRVESYRYDNVLSVKVVLGSILLTLASGTAAGIGSSKKDERNGFVSFVSDKIQTDPRVSAIEAQLRKLDGASRFLGYREIKELPSILWDSEQIHDAVQGFYESGQGLLVSTDRRLVFINKGLVFGLRVEDFPNDKITSIQYETKLLFGSITIFSSGNKAVIEQIDKGQARSFAEGVRSRLAAHESTEPTHDARALVHDDLTSQLEQLSLLKDKGILTEEEFAAKKKQLLGI